MKDLEIKVGYSFRLPSLIFREKESKKVLYEIGVLPAISLLEVLDTVPDFKENLELFIEKYAEETKERIKKERERSSLLEANFLAQQESVYKKLDDVVA